MFPLYETRALPACPFLVVIRITPLDALEPYIAVADASFKTVKVSMSFEFILLRGSDIPLTPLVLSTGTPSITIRGSLLADIDDPPLIRIVEPAPGAPPDDTILRPATFPANISEGLVASPLLRDVASTATTDPVASSFLTDPYPITTSSSNSALSSSRTMFIVVLLLIEIICGL